MHLGWVLSLCKRVYNFGPPRGHYHWALVYGVDRPFRLDGVIGACAPALERGLFKLLGYVQ